MSTGGPSSSASASASQQRARPSQPPAAPALKGAWGSGRPAIKSSSPLPVQQAALPPSTSAAARLTPSIASSPLDLARSTTAPLPKNASSAVSGGQQTRPPGSIIPPVITTPSEPSSRSPAPTWSSTSSLVSSPASSSQPSRRGSQPKYPSALPSPVLLPAFTMPPRPTTQAPTVSSSSPYSSASSATAAASLLSPPPPPSSSKTTTTTPSSGLDYPLLLSSARPSLSASAPAITFSRRTEHRIPQAQRANISFWSEGIDTTTATTQSNGFSGAGAGGLMFGDRREGSMGDEGPRKSPNGEGSASAAETSTSVNGTATSATPPPNGARAAFAIPGADISPLALHASVPRSTAPSSPRSSTLDDTASTSSTAPPASTPPTTTPSTPRTEASESSVPTPTPAPPKPKAPPSSWAALLRPPPSAINPASVSTTSLPASAPASSSSVNNRKGGKRVKPSSLARLLAIGPASGEGLVHGSNVRARGLVNRGNLCFVNSILQVLVFTPRFHRLFALLAGLVPADLQGQSYPLVDAMVNFLREFATSSADSDGDDLFHSPASEGSLAFVPDGVYDALAKVERFSFMRQGHQEDAEEFLGFFLNTLHEEVLALLARQPAHAVAAVRSAAGTLDDLGGEAGLEEGVRVAGAGNGASDNTSGWLEVGRKNKTSLLRTTESRPSSITALFTGTLRSTLVVPSAPSFKPSITIEPFSPLQLDVEPSQVLSVADALRHLVTPETIHGVSLGRSQTADASKQCLLESLPDVLVLHLKRFGWMMGSDFGGGARKMGKVVAYGEDLVVPQETISPTRRSSEPVRYKLFGVVYHHGPTVSSGHYTSAVLSKRSPSSLSSEADEWLHIDDELVTRLPRGSHDVCVSDMAAREGEAGEIGGRERCAYLLFYERV